MDKVKKTTSKFRGQLRYILLNAGFYAKMAEKPIYPPDYL